MARTLKALCEAHRKMSVTAQSTQAPYTDHYGIPSMIFLPEPCASLGAAQVSLVLTASPQTTINATGIPISSASNADHLHLEIAICCAALRASAVRCCLVSVTNIFVWRIDTVRKSCRYRRRVGGLELCPVRRHPSKIYDR